MKSKNNFICNIIDEDLKNKKIKTINTRFPPEPNGYLHIGHAKSICINFGIAEQYKGNCNLRFDDTNPLKENSEYVNSIINDVKWLEFNWDKTWSENDYPKAYKRQLEMYQWLFKKNGFQVAKEAYLLYFNGKKNEKVFNNQLNFDKMFESHYD